MYLRFVHYLYMGTTTANSIGACGGCVTFVDIFTQPDIDHIVEHAYTF